MLAKLQLKLFLGLGFALMISINQSINQSTNQIFDSANMPCVTGLSGGTAESMFNSKIDEAVLKHQWAIGHANVDGGMVESERSVLRRFLKVVIMVIERIDSQRLFDHQFQVCSHWPVTPDRHLFASEYSCIHLNIKFVFLPSAHTALC